MNNMNKIGICLLVKNEIDIIKTWLNHHIPMCDYMVIMDNGSYDGTREVIDFYAEKFNIKVIDQPAQDYNQKIWVLEMIDWCKKAGCTHVLSADTDEMYDADLRIMAEKLTGDLGAYKIPCRLYVPTIFDDENILNPIERMKYYLKTGRTQEESQCLVAWSKMFFSLADFKELELGNDVIRFNSKNTKTEIAKDAIIRHYPERSWQQYRLKYIQGGEAYARSKHPAMFGWHWKKIHKIYFTGGIVALKRFWYNLLEDNKELLIKD
jgi:hypothetical protein